MRDLIEEMTTFAVVARAGSFTAAAHQLQRSKAYVSLQVSRLESAIGLQLLFRTTRRLELTEAGRAYLDYCAQLLDTVDEAGRAVDALKGSMTGILRLSVPVSFGQVFLTEVITAFQQHYPEVQVQLELHNAFRDLKVQGLDMAVRISSELKADLVAIRIGDLSTPIYGSPSYFARHGRPRAPDDLAKHTAILHNGVDADQRWPMLIDGDIQRHPISWRMSVNHYPLIREAAIQGQGLARLPSYLAEKDVAAGKLDAVLTDFLPPPQPIYLVYDYQGALPLKNRTFIDFTRKWFADRQALMMLG
ncbi:LysR family transcriptional regulator [Motiliproteus sp. SC1-56]|uniref:LysR family transcriptional regulator n=1 Tax=Motiliproteus sp. SC1-56 TaxID=2799565 RepID=UPI001A8CACAE|nr:LysR family transcriptional regulator [Motiliproteus sp. SC1-56]